MKEQILSLRLQGKTYKEIINIVGCSKGTVSYYCGHNQKTKNHLRQIKRRKRQHPFKSKLEHFLNKKSTYVKKLPISTIKSLLNKKLSRFKLRNKNMSNITLEEVINKFGENPICYLTGEQLDISKPSTYHFDHIIPPSKGGDNSLDNLGICTKTVNMAKSDLTKDEFINLCKKVLLNNGYQVNKI